MSRSPRRALHRLAVSVLCVLIGASAARPQLPLPRTATDLISRESELVDLGVVSREPVSNGGEAVATHISDNGLVYGLVRGAEPSAPFRWESGVVTWLDTLDQGAGSIVEVNARGDAVGTVPNEDPNAGPTTRAVVWPRGETVPISLGVAGVESVGNDINDRRVVAGAARIEGQGVQAVIWRRNGDLVVLDDPGVGAQ